MSFVATRWAWAQKTQSSSQKLVLLALADCAENDSWEYNPSVARLSSMTGLDRKTIMKALLQLANDGLVTARGRNGGKKTYVLNGRPVPNMGQVNGATDTKNGTGTESGTSTKYGMGTDTKNGTGTSTNFGTHTYQPICLSIDKQTKDIDVCNREESLDAPLSEQLENCQLSYNEADLEDPDHVLTALQFVILGKTYGVRLANNATIETIANRKTITVELFGKCVTKWKQTLINDKPTGTGYLIGILKNASMNPEAFQESKPAYDKEALRGFFEDCGLHDF